MQSHKWYLTCPILLLAAPLFIEAKLPPTDDRLICKESFLDVVSPDDVTVEQCRMAAKKVLAAWKFDLNSMRWRDPAVNKGPMTLRLISDERMNREHRGGARAVTRGNVFSVELGLIDTTGLDLTFAHELGHVQSLRASGARWHVPNYFLEGHGLMMNQLGINILDIPCTIM